VLAFAVKTTLVPWHTTFDGETDIVEGHCAFIVEKIPSDKIRIMENTSVANKKWFSLTFIKCRPESVKLSIYFDFRIMDKSRDSIFRSFSFFKEELRNQVY
jgi:hypothetical protein